MTYLRSRFENNSTRSASLIQEGVLKISTKFYFLCSPITILKKQITFDDHSNFLCSPLVHLPFLPNIFSSSLFCSPDVYDVTSYGKGFHFSFMAHTRFFILKPVRVRHLASPASCIR